MVSTGRMEANDLKSRVVKRKVEHDKFDKLLAQLIEKPELIRPPGDWPQHWGDAIHEEDGGFDEFGASPRDGREL